MKKLLFCLTTSLFLLSGCSNDDFVGSKISKKNSITTINATTDNPVETRAQLIKGDDVEVFWHRGDKISVFSDEQGLTEYKLRSGEGTSSASFVGDEVTGNTFYALSIPMHYYSPSPDQDIVLDRENHVVYFDHSCFGMIGKEFDENAIRIIPMIARSQDNNMSFKQLAGILHFSITGTHKLTSMDLITPDRTITGRAKVDYAAANPVMEMTGEPTVSIPGNLLSKAASYGGPQLKPDEPLDVYFIVPPGEYHGLVLDMRTQTGLVIRRQTDNVFNVGRGTVKHFTAMDTDGYLEEVRKPTYDKLMAFYNAMGGDNWLRKDNWGSDLPFDEWYGVDGGYYDVQSIQLPNNNLTGVLTEDITKLPDLGYVDIRDNNIEGTLPDNIKNMNNLWYLNINGNKFDGVISKSIQDSEMWKSLEIVFSHQQDGYQLLLSDYISTDFSKDGLYSLIQMHTKGNGIPIVLMGDGFSDRLVADGTYESSMRATCDNFFAIEPYTSFRDYFDVYMVNAVSKEERIGGETVFEVGYTGDKYNVNTQTVRSYVKKIAAFNDNLQNVISIVVINGKSEAREVANLFSDGFAIALTNVNDDGYLTHHEAGGHAFGKLGDEYSSDDKTGERRFSSAYNPDFINSQNLGWYLNLSYYDDPETVYWADFLTNHDYDIEEIGMYEGGYISYSKGIWRPTYTSIMGPNINLNQFQIGYRDFYNAPSRWIIYQRIMDLAGVSYTFDDFLLYDKINLQAIAELKAATRSISILKKKERKLGGAPIINNYPSTEIGMH